MCAVPRRLAEAEAVEVTLEAANGPTRWRACAVMVMRRCAQKCHMVPGPLPSVTNQSRNGSPQLAHLSEESSVRGPGRCSVPLRVVFLLRLIDYIDLGSLSTPDDVVVGPRLHLEASPLMTSSYGKASLTG